jgi:hypothetical protein
MSNVQFDDYEDEQDVAEQLSRGSVAAVVQGNDWTTETIVAQMKRGNIALNPRFQRRDAWSKGLKSRFIESLIVGLPIPQIVLAESADSRGKFMVLDGKQRLLSILQFWGDGEGPNNAYGLSGLTLRPDLKGKSFANLLSEPSLEEDYNDLCNQPIRTVVIRNWKDTDFLHTIFLRLNTGSIKLSPQELRQALFPGPFSDHIDDAAGESKALRELLKLNQPDPRMRDIEIFARFLSFRFYAEEYPGRMKAFLDLAFHRFNSGWNTMQAVLEVAEKDFEEGTRELLRVFEGRVARKPDSPQFNRAIFDCLIYYHSKAEVRDALAGRDQEVRDAYRNLFVGTTEFVDAVESDTAGSPNTSTRLRLWGDSLRRLIGDLISVPAIPEKKPMLEAIPAKA